MVLLYHTWLFCGAPAPYWWNPLGGGYLGVDLFLLLSGFCLYWPFVVKEPAYRPTLRSFLARRARRLLPPYYAALLLFTLAALAVPAYPERPAGGTRAIFHTLLWHLALLHNLRPGHISALAGQFWTLALEAQLYIAMPLLVVVARRFGIQGAVGLAAFVSLSYRLALNQYVGGTPFWTTPANNEEYRILMDWTAGRWIEFGLGMWAASLVAARAVNRLRIPFGLLSGLLLLGGAWLSREAPPFKLFDVFPVGLGCFCLILWGSRETVAPMRAGRAAVLRCRPLVKLGVISYSVYLLHQPLLLAAVLASKSRLPGFGPLFALSLCVFIPVIVGMSLPFYMLFEKPFLNKPVLLAPVETPPAPSAAALVEPRWAKWEGTDA